jgi:thiol-disulfide isomerase/thioredoxin
VVLGIMGYLAVSEPPTGDDVVRLDGATPTVPAPASASDVEGAAAPPVSWTTFEGARTGLGDLDGRPVLLNFWASTCTPCVQEMPDLQAAHAEVGDRVAFVGLAVADAEPRARAMAERTGVRYPLGFDPSGEVLRSFGGAGLPTTVLIGADGTVLDVHTGALDAEQIRARTAELLS